MATGQPPTGNPAQNVEHSPSPAPISWDGDRMFNIYIYDYCVKRGYQKTARELLAEAEIPHDSQPPINAKQGLLFEWWSVFWVLFTAKSSGNGTDDALLYTQYQASQANQRPGLPRAPQQPTTQPRYMPPANGVRTGPPPGTLPNGVTPVGGLSGQPTMQNGAQPGPWSGPMPPQNGVAGPSHATGPSLGTSAQPMMHAQRPGAVPQRAPNGAQFQSPTMAHSPQQAGPGHGGLQPPHMGGPMGPQNPMAQMRPGMYQPGAPQGMMGNPQQPAPAFQPLPGQSASHPNSPAAAHTMHQSPSLGNRQPQMPPGGNRAPSEIRQMQEASVNSEFFKIDSARLQALREEVGLSGVDLPSMTLEDKQKLVALAKERGALHSSAKPGQGPPQNAAAGPSNPQIPPNRNQLGPPFAQQAQNQRIKRNSTSPGDENDQSQNDSSSPANKRPRTSPSGPDQQQSQPPMAPLVPGYPPQQHMQGVPGGPQHPMMPPMPGSNGSFASQVGPRMGGPQGMNVPGHNSVPGPHMNNPMVANPMMQYRQSMTAIHKNNLPSGAQNSAMPGNAPSPAAAGSPYPIPTDGSHSRPGTSQYSGQNRQGPGGPQGKPMSMLPPPSPSMNHAKNPIKNEDAGSNNPPGVHSSPRNAPAVTGQQQSQQQAGPSQQPNQGMGTAPPTPAPAAATITAPSPSAILNNNQQGGSQGQQQQHQHQQQGGQNPAGNQRPPSAAGPSAPPPEFILPPDFMQSLTMPGAPFDSFDSASLFQPDSMGGGTDFDRDFGEWFHSDTI